MLERSAEADLLIVLLAAAINCSKVSAVSGTNCARSLSSDPERLLPCKPEATASAAWTDSSRSMDSADFWPRRNT
eukprot:scaffold3272_cov239-Pinguiococcus_pyrenoidosus.AAC.10